MLHKTGKKSELHLLCSLRNSQLYDHVSLFVCVFKLLELRYKLVSFYYWCDVGFVCVVCVVCCCVVIVVLSYNASKINLAARL